MLIALLALIPLLSALSSRGGSYGGLLLIAIALFNFRDALRKVPLTRMDTVAGWVLLALLTLNAAHAIARGLPLSVLQAPLICAMAFPLMIVLRGQRSITQAIMMGCLAGAMASGALGLWQHEIQGIARAGGFHHYIAFANMAVLFALITSLTRPSGRMGLIVSSLAWIGAIGAIIASQTRSSLIAAVAACFYYILQKGNPRYTRAALVAMASGLILVMAMPGRMNDLISEIGHYRQQQITGNSMGQRLSIWDMGIRAWRQQPLTGIGPGNSKALITAQAHDHLASLQGLSHMHNDLLETLVTLGLPGAALWLAWYIVIWRRFNASTHIQTKTAGHTYLIALLIMCMTETLAGQSIMITISTLLLAALWSQCENTSRLQG
ncbi:O-antigen ligase family protein [Burkholderiaceae bacterium DAT-1]|nr:O-antigen ligase family protein [Burkholderiaceae bacterium DAT-1]